MPAQVHVPGIVDVAARRGNYPLDALGEIEPRCVPGGFARIAYQSRSG
jgi:hypothetical protein